MNDGIVYMFTGNKHAVAAAVAIKSARQWWDGGITIFCDETAKQFAEPIALDAGCEVGVFRPVNLRRNSGFFNKTLVPQMTPYGTTLQLDLDTLVVGRVDQLMEVAAPDKFLVTQFADWVSTGRIISKRIRKWEEACPELVAAKIEHPGPALNTGVVAYGKDSWVAKHVWHEVAKLNKGVIWGDEQAADLMLGQPQWAEYMPVYSDSWNASPIYSSGDGVVIWHGHGSKFWKRQRGVEVWYPHFRKAWDENFGGIRDWWRWDENKHFKRLLKDNPGFLAGDLDTAQVVTVQA